MDPVTPEEVDAFLSPSKLWRRDEIQCRPNPVPAVAGVYGWWFNEIPGAIDVRGCHRWNDLVLLYTGISPKRPPGSGRPPSRGQLRQRLQTHCSGNAEGSTLRKTLGCLLTERLGIELRRVGSGKRMTFVEGEAALSRWMSEHAFVSWVERERPWELEDHLIARLDLPLNLEGNARNAFHTELSGVRARSVSRANALPVVPNPGAGGSMAPRLPAAGRE